MTSGSFALLLLYVNKPIRPRLSAHPLRLTDRQRVDRLCAPLNILFGDFSAIRTSKITESCAHHLSNRFTVRDIGPHSTWTRTSNISLPISEIKPCSFSLRVLLFTGVGFFVSKGLGLEVPKYFCNRVFSSFIINCNSFSFHRLVHIVLVFC